MTITVTVPVNDGSDGRLTPFLVNGTADTSALSATQFTVHDIGSQIDVVLIGNGLTYDGGNNVDGGTITQIQIVSTTGPTLRVDFTGLNVDAQQLYDAIVADDTATINDLILNADDIDYTGGAGDDFFNGGSQDDVLRGGDGDDQLNGGDGDDQLNGGGGDDFLSGNVGDDILNGGDGDDTVTFGGATVVVTVNLGANFANTDTLISVENARGGTLADSLTGSNGDNVLRGSGGDDVIDGGFGSDTADFADKTQSVVVTLNGAAQVRAVVNGVDEDFLTNIENLRGGSAADTLTGDANDNRFRGNGGNDILDGGAGSDTAEFTDKNTAVVVVLNGATPVIATVNGVNEDTLSNIENLRGGSAADTFTGDALDNTFRGNGGDDILDGGAGSDTVQFNDKTTSVVLTLDGGTPVRANVGGVDEDFLSNIENVDGGDGDDTLTGDGLDNELHGRGGQDILMGAGGNDTLNGGSDGAIVNTLDGGTGNDLYELGASNDIVVETNGNGNGIDTISTTVSRSLGDYASVEDLILQGFDDGVPVGAINGTGNALGNTIHGNDSVNVLSGMAGADNLFGNGGDDTLDGGEGLDTLDGGLGNDSYQLGTDSDIIVDAGGVDTATSTITRSLTAYTTVENLTLIGGNLNGDGNGLANIIIGTTGVNVLFGGSGNDQLIAINGNDTLNGGLGNDRLEGGSGNDIYVVNSTGDVLVESSGIDLVKSTVTYTLKSGFEKLTLISGNISGTGNSSANTIIGSTGANKLFGVNGNDLLSGGNGNDRLDGGRGNDSLNGGSNNDRLDGGLGNDLLNGAAGNDILTGGLGRDIMVGSAGADDFDFNSIAESRLGSARDVINAFQRGIDDIDLRTIDARSGSGNQAFTFIGTDAFNDVRGELRYRDLGSTCIVQGDVNGDGRADFEIAVKASSLARGDFLL